MSVTTASILFAGNASPPVSAVEKFTAAPVIPKVAPGANFLSRQMADENTRTFSYFRNCENVEVRVEFATQDISEGVCGLPGLRKRQSRLAGLTPGHNVKGKDPGDSRPSLWRGVEKFLVRRPLVGKFL
jgi:hypothetical protein